MATRGNPTIVFNSVTLDNDDCFQSAGVTANGNPVEYQCNGTMRYAPGAASYQIQFSATYDATKLAAFRENVASTCDYYPNGNAAGKIKRAASNATVSVQTTTDNPTGVQLMDVTILLDDLTDTTVS